MLTIVLEAIGGIAVVAALGCMTLFLIKGIRK